jgi:hypothetical protein
MTRPNPVREGSDDLVLVTCVAQSSVSGNSCSEVCHSVYATLKELLFTSLRPGGKDVSAVNSRTESLPAN